MNYTRRCTGYLLAIFLLPFTLSGQDQRERSLNAAHALYEAGDEAGARVQYQSVTQGEDGNLVIDSLTGMAFHKLGLMAYYAEEDATALSHYLSAIRVRDGVFPEPHNERAHSRYAAATLLHWEGKFDTASVLIREAIGMFEAVEEVDSLNWLRSLNELGAIAVDQKDYRIAFSSSYRAIEIVETASEGKFHPDDVFNTYYGAAQIMMPLGQLELAKRYCQRALDHRDGLNDPYYVPDAYDVLGTIYLEMEEEEKAFRDLQLARRLSHEYGGNPATLAHIDLNLSQYYARTGDRKQAMDHSLSALALFREYEMDTLDYYAYDKLPASLVLLGDTSLALQHYDQRLELLDEAKYTWVRITLLGERAAILGQRGELTAALTDYEALFQLQGQLRDNVTSDDSRHYISKNLRPLFDDAIALYYRLYRQNQDEAMLWEAYALSERARAYSLLTSIRADRDAGYLQELKLKRSIAQLERKVATGDDHLQPRLETARLQLDRITADRASETAREPEVFDRNRLIDHLVAHDFHLLQYHLGKRLSLVFYLPPSGELTVLEIPDNELVTDRVNAFRDIIQRSSYRRKSLRSAAEQQELDGEFLHTGAALAAQLLPPGLLEPSHPRPRLCIVPDGSLNYLPFGALPLSEPTLPLDYSSIAYLQRTSELFYAYSASFLLDIAERDATDYQLKFVAFAPTFGTDNAIAAESRAMKGGALSPLQYNLEEVDQIGKMFGNSQTYVGNKANREQFFRMVGTSEILHLSSHGKVNATDPNLSFIAFTHVGDSLQEEELLFFNDLYTLNLDNELTVLSACETNLGQLAPGETPLSLASAFAAAGARSTLTTLWEVDDRATKDLLVDFYEKLLAGNSRSAALATAQETMLGSADFFHPYYWSGLTLYGAAGPIATDGENENFWFGFVAGLIAFILLIVVSTWVQQRKEAKAERDDHGV